MTPTAGLPSGWRGALGVLLLAAALLLAFPGSRALRNPDEPREAELARGYWQGEWGAVPHLNGREFLEKPPLYPWLLGEGFRVAGGPSDAAARVVTALFGVAAALATWAIGETLLGAGAGLLAALLLVGTPFAFDRFRACTTDAPLAAFTTLSLACFFRGHARGSWRWAALAGPFAGLAFLSKGLAGLAVPAVAAAGFLAFRRDARAILRLHLWLPVLLGIAVAAPWLLAVRAEAGDEGLLSFLDGQLGKRLGSGADHAAGPLYYAGVFLYALPWMIPALAGAAAAFRSAEVRALLLGPLCWALGGILLFSLFASKRAGYLLPLYPALALLAAGAVVAADRGLLGGVPAATVRWTVAAFGGWARLVPPLRLLGLRGAACAAGLLLGAGALATDLVRARMEDPGEAGRAFVAEADRVAAGRPLVLFRVGEGDQGQFTFPLRRTIPVAWNEAQLREAAGGRPVVVLAEPRKLEQAVREWPEKGISPALRATLRRVGDGVAGGTPYDLYEWDGR